VNSYLRVPGDLGGSEQRLPRDPGGKADTLERDWERMATFYRFPKEHWKHLRTTNVMESPFAALRLRTDAAKRYKKVASATTIVWKMLLVAEQRFRKLDATGEDEGGFPGC